MRGCKTDALRGATFKDSPFAPPFDRFYQDNMLIRPMAHIDNSQSDFHYELAKRRDLPIKVVNYPLIPAYTPDARQPSAMENNGIAPLPNAGVYRRQSNIIVGGVIVG